MASSWARCDGKFMGEVRAPPPGVALVVVACVWSRRVQGLGSSIKQKEHSTSKLDTSVGLLAFLALEKKNCLKCEVK